ncbi:glycoside hydrolase family 108 protein [Pleionea sediminis]|uniref:glycoside hydrolase family 108 protein n=1 Tax=Pleionea sediminis TaxID=2569479 RepID=UPI00118508EF|nr:glycosyl hydrolase 108 family protein [Pleionea sediminis]
MALFDICYEKTILNEGGYKLHKVPFDRGGLTYAGISQKYHPDWRGWEYVTSEHNQTHLMPLVKEFYQNKFWNVIKGDYIDSQEMADTIYDFAVNAGCRTAIKLSQIVVGCTPDGIVGPNTLNALNSFHPEIFLSNYALAKVQRYMEICKRDTTQSKFLLGWLNRSIGALS